MFKFQDWKRIGSAGSKLFAQCDVITTTSGVHKEITHQVCEDTEVKGHHALWELLTRRGITWDMVNICPFVDHAEITTLFFDKLNKPSPNVQLYNKVTIEQCRLADAEISSLISKHCRHGIRKNAVGKYPIAEAIKEAVKHPDVLFHLQPLPKPQPTRGGSDKGSAGEEGGGNKRGRSGEDSRTPGPGKGQKRKFGTRGPRIPDKFKNTCPEHPTLKKRFCFRFNDGGCNEAARGEACSRGLHMCPVFGCYKNHPMSEHRK